jgi:hypothetical protein
MIKRITHKHVQNACNTYNKALKLKRDSIGFIMWADIRGDGAGYRPNLYTVVNVNGGVCQSDLKRKTMRKTIRAIDLARVADKSQGWCLIIRAIHERGEVQAIALREMRARGLWLSAEQKIQAGLVERDA